MINLDKKGGKVGGKGNIATPSGDPNRQGSKRWRYLCVIGIIVFIILGLCYLLIPRGEEKEQAIYDELGVFPDGAFETNLTYDTTYYIKEDIISSDDASDKNQEDVKNSSQKRIDPRFQHPDGTYKQPWEYAAEFDDDEDEDDYEEGYDDGYEDALDEM